MYIYAMPMYYVLCVHCVHQEEMALVDAHLAEQGAKLEEVYIDI
jgi:hypothetical protein